MTFVHYEDLKVYRLAYRLVLEIHAACRELPPLEQNGLADQMRRASRSICANMAEGLSKVTSSPEERRFLGIARGSCEEMRVWSQMGLDFGYWSADQSVRWREEYNQVSKMIFALMDKRSS